MYKRDIKARFDDWLVNPTEGPDFEVKGWLDLSTTEHQGIVAKALIALENHGGGFLLIGYKEDAEKRFVPDPNRPESLKPYLTDGLNTIVKKRAEPAFHVEVTVQRHPEDGQEYPLVHVSGQSKVPVRSSSGTAKSLTPFVYYIRAPGPESRGPNTAAEWDNLIKRAVSRQRTEILELLRNFLPAGQGMVAPTVVDSDEQLRRFARESTARWASKNDSLPSGHRAKISKGYFAFSAKIDGVLKNVAPQQIIAAIRDSRRYTGWPPFHVFEKDGLRPTPVEGGIEAWLAEGQNSNVGNADFWRIEPSGEFFVLRGYQEDAGEFRLPRSGKGLEAVLPVWRLGEFLIRVGDLASVMFEERYDLVVLCEWTGLSGRTLFTHQVSRRLILDECQASEDQVKTEGRFAEQVIKEQLPSAVRALTTPLYQVFDFFAPEDSFYSAEIAEMMGRRSS